MSEQFGGRITMAELRTFYPGLAQVAEATMRNPVDPETAEWLDGPSFARWLDSIGFSADDPSLERRMRDWRGGVAVNLEQADRCCIAADSHLSHIPDNCWRTRPPRLGNVRVPASAKAAAVRATMTGRTVVDVAEEFLVSPHALHEWRRLPLEDLDDCAKAEEVLASGDGRAFRERLGLTPDDICRMGKIAKGQVAQWERGEVLPTVQAGARYWRTLDRVGRQAMADRFSIHPGRESD